jgi:hypothetical protein
VQIIDVNGSGLPSIVARFTDPVSQQPIDRVWLNTGSGWDGDHNHFHAPCPLDAVYREPKTLVQFVGVSGDGLPDLVMTKGGCSGCSQTWLATGKDLDSDNGWHESADWRVPDKAIGQKDGDPGFRLFDIKGDGYPDILWIRQKDDGTYDKGLLINNGAGWIDSTTPILVPDLPFVDKNGVDQGVRLLSVTGKGLTDIVASFQGRTQTVEVNKARRADVLDSVTDGYGLKTSVFYQTLLEVDGADKDSGVVTNPPPGIPTDRPLGWRTYESGSPDSYPKVAPVPTTYVVRKATVDEGDGRTVVFDYRYGRYRVDSDATRSLGFGW